MGLECYRGKYRYLREPHTETESMRSGNSALPSAMDPPRMTGQDWDQANVQGPILQGAVCSLLGPNCDTDNVDAGVSALLDLRLSPK